MFPSLNNKFDFGYGYGHRKEFWDWKWKLKWKMSSSSTNKKRKLGENEQKFYAVRAGKQPGVYLTWKECQDNTTGFKGASCEFILVSFLVESVSLLLVLLTLLHDQ